MRFLVLTFFAGVAVGLMPAAGAKAYPECHLHKTRVVSFANANSKDVLEVSIGTGVCYAATLSIVIRTERGIVLYSYVAPFKRHVATYWEDSELPVDAAAFVDEVIAAGVGSTKTLPPWPESDDEILIPRQAYEALRAKPRPMFEHANHYEGWQTVIYDDVKEESVIILRGGA